MNRVPDRAKMRREYLWKKSVTDTEGFAGFVLTLASAISAVLCAMFLLLSVFDWRLIVFDPYFILGLLLSGGLSLYGLRVWAAKCEAARRLVYVPPVQEQMALLQDEEILLRGSQAAASPDELLRPAIRQDSEAAALLRPTNTT